MTLLTNSAIRICADCPSGYSQPMKKMPGLNEVYMCTQCFGVNYRSPEEWAELTEEQQGEVDDNVLYREETSGE